MLTRAGASSSSSTEGFMRKLMMVGIACIAAAFTAPASAQQDADAIRRELEQMRKNFETMRQEYQKQMDAMAERLRRLESQASEGAGSRANATPAPVAVPGSGPTPAPAVAQTPPQGGGLAPSTPSAMDLLTPRQPFGLY